MRIVQHRVDQSRGSMHPLTNERVVVYNALVTVKSLGCTHGVLCTYLAQGGNFLVQDVEFPQDAIQLIPDCGVESEAQ